MQSYDCIFLLPNVIVKLLSFRRSTVVKIYPTLPKKQLARKATFSFIQTDKALLNGLTSPTITHDAAKGTKSSFGKLTNPPKVLLNKRASAKYITNEDIQVAMLAPIILSCGILIRTAERIILIISPAERAINGSNIFPARCKVQISILLDERNIRAGANERSISAENLLPNRRLRIFSGKKKHTAAEGSASERMRDNTRSAAFVVSLPTLIADANIGVAAALTVAIIPTGRLNTVCA